MATDSRVEVTTGQDTTVHVTAYPLSEPDARLLRVYRHWLDRRDLLAKIWCPDCEIVRSTGMEIGLSPTKVGLICPHGMWFGITAVAPRLVTDHQKPQRRAIVLAIVEPETLSQTEAQMLWTYQSFLKRYRLREALYCLTCDLSGQADGVRAAVTPREIRIECRHALRSYRRPK